MSLPSCPLLCRPVRWLALLLVSLTFSFPTSLKAARAGGGTTTTMTLTYVNGVQKWVCRIDPLNVAGFQLDLQWDPTRAQLDTSSPIPIIYKIPFAQNTVPILDQAGGRLSDVGGTTNSPVPGDADVFELVFIDLQPGVPPDQATFTVFASANDFIKAFDTDSGQTVTFTSTQIASTSRSASLTVHPHIWDPDGVYNSGHTGGPGTWNTTLNEWDDLPLPNPSATPSLTNWNNATHANDVAVFAGDPGTGVVSVQAPISAGGFRFDNSGYDIQGNIITLAAPPGSTPTIDTGANNAMISSTLTGNGPTKVGTGTLTLTGANTYTGPTLVNGGTLLANNATGSGTSNGPVSVPTPGAVLGGSGAISGPVGISPNATLLGGDGKTASGSLTIGNNLTMGDGSRLALALGEAGTHSTLTRGGGTWTFAPGQSFNFRNIGAQPGFYDNIITGLPSDPGGVGSWTILNIGFAGTFSYDGNGNIDLNLTAVAPAITIISISRLTNGHIGLQCSGIPYQPNTIKTSPDLVTQFAPATSIQADSNGAFQYEDRTPPTRRFYIATYP